MDITFKWQLRKGAMSYDYPGQIADEPSRIKIDPLTGWYVSG